MGSTTLVDLLKGNVVKTEDFETALNELLKEERFSQYRSNIRSNHEKGVLSATIIGKGFLGRGYTILRVNAPGMFYKDCEEEVKYKDSFVKLLYEKIHQEYNPAELESLSKAKKK